MHALRGAVCAFPRSLRASYSAHCAVRGEHRAFLGAVRAFLRPARVFGGAVRAFRFARRAVLAATVRISRGFAAIIGVRRHVLLFGARFSTRLIHWPKTTPVRPCGRVPTAEPLIPFALKGAGT